MLSNMAKCLLAGVFLLVLVIFAYHERTGAIGGLADDDDTGTSTCIAQENDLKQKIESKDTSIKNLLMQNSELEEKTMQCKDDLQAANSTLRQCERRLGLCDKRFVQKKKELSDCQAKILEYGPEDANAAQQEIWFLRKQVNELKETLKTTVDDCNQLEKELKTVQQDHAVSANEHKNVKNQHDACEYNKEALAHEKTLNQEAMNSKTSWLNTCLTIFFMMGVMVLRDNYGQLARERQQSRREHEELLTLRATIAANQEQPQLGQLDQPAIGQNDGAGQNVQAPEEQGGGGENEDDPPHSIHTPPVQVALPSN